MASNPPVTAPPAASAPAAAAPPAPAAPAAPKVTPEQAAAKLLADIKALLVYEMQAKGYAPHMGDVTTAATRLVELVKDAGGKAEAYLAAMDAKVKAYKDGLAKKAAADQAVAQKAAAEAAAAAKAGVTVPPAVPVPDIAPGAPIPVAPVIAKPVGA